MKKISSKFSKSRILKSRSGKRRPAYAAKWLEKVEMVANVFDVSATQCSYGTGGGTSFSNYWVMQITGKPTHQTDVSYNWNKASDNSTLLSLITTNNGQTGSVNEKDIGDWWGKSDADIYPGGSKNWKIANNGNPAIYTNISGVWEPGSMVSKVAPSGAASIGVALANLQNGAAARLSILNLPGHGWVTIGAHRSPDGSVRFTSPVKLQKAENYCLEIAVNPDTGKTSFWLNDQGWDMGILAGLENGAHAPLVFAETLHAGDHLPSGHLSECALASNGQWESAYFTAKTARIASRLALHQEAKFSSRDSITFRDLRSAVI